jgi:hypothetical protein
MTNKKGFAQPPRSVGVDFSSLGATAANKKPRTQNRRTSQQEMTDGSGTASIDFIRRTELA